MARVSTLRVRIDSFALSKYKVTFEEYDASPMRRVASGQTTQVRAVVGVP